MPFINYTYTRETEKEHHRNMAHFKTDECLSIEMNNYKLSLPIIVMMAFALKGEKTKCREVGMNEYLSKPFDAKFLYKKISEKY